MPDLEKLFYINVGPGGTFKPSGIAANDFTPADVDALFDHLKAQHKKKIFIYFHGGAVNEKKGMAIARRFKEKIADTSDVHPITFVWETGVFGTILQNLQEIHGTKLFRKLIEKAVKLAGARLGIELETAVGSRGVGNLSDDEIKAEMNKDVPFEHYDVNFTSRSAMIPIGLPDHILQESVEADLEVEFESDPEFQEAIEEEKSEKELKHLEIEKLNDEPIARSRGIIQWAKAVFAIGKIIVRIIKRHIKNRDHGFYPTIIEEILRELYLANFGAWVFGGMKEKALRMWKDDNVGATALGDIHAGAYFLKKLDAYVKANSGTTIDLGGVSLGTVAICHLIQKMAETTPDLKIRNLIMMAPACRCELFNDTVLKFPQTFSSIRIFTMRDENEIKDRLVPVIYTRSILYLISGALEDKGESFDAYILGLQRHISNKPPYDSEDVLGNIHTFLKANSERTVFSNTDGSALDGFRSGALKHTLFDDDEDTLNSILHIVKQ